MGTKFMNSKNSKISNLHRSFITPSFRQNELNRNHKYVAILNLSIYYAWKNIKKS